MPTFAHIEDPSTTHHPPPTTAPMHLGKRLLRERERLGLPIDAAALALQTDPHTIRTLEAGDVIPPRLSARLRTYLKQLEALPTPPPGTPHPSLPASSPLSHQGRGSGGEGPTVPAPAPSPPPLPSRLSPQHSGLTDWDAGHLYTEIDTRRRALGLSWNEVARQTGIHSVSLRNLHKNSYLKTTTRAKLVAWLDRTTPAAPPSDAPPEPPEPPMLDSDTSATLRSQMIHAMLDRKLNKFQLAQQLGLKRTIVGEIIKTPGILLPQDLADAITTWLNASPATTPTTHHPLPTEDLMPAPDLLDDTISPVVEDLSNVEPPDRAPVDQPMSNPQADAPPLSLLIRRLVDSLKPETAADDGDTEDEADTPDEPRPDPRPMRLFTNINLHLPRPSRHDTALLALLDKFPDYDAMPTTGEQSQWFRYFESLARLALASQTEDKP